MVQTTCRKDGKRPPRWCNSLILLHLWAKEDDSKLLAFHNFNFRTPKSAPKMPVDLPKCTLPRNPWQLTTLRASVWTTLSKTRAVTEMRLQSLSTSSISDQTCSNVCAKLATCLPSTPVSTSRKSTICWTNTLWAHQLLQQEVNGFESRSHYHQKRLSEESLIAYVNIKQWFWINQHSKKL